MQPQLTRDVRQNLVTGHKLDLKRCIWKSVDYTPFDFNRLFFCHSTFRNELNTSNTKTYITKHDQINALIIAANVEKPTRERPRAWSGHPALRV